MFDELHKAIFESCPKGLWSKGVKMARDGAVRTQPSEEGERVVRVQAPGRAVAPTVVLHLDDCDWECDCASRAQACAHVAAAVIASKNDLEDAPQPTEETYLEYRFVRFQKQLFVERHVVAPDATTPLPYSLAHAAARKIDLGFAPSHDDMRAEAILNHIPRGRGISQSQLISLLKVLESGCRVAVDGQRVTTSGEKWLPRARITDSGDGVRLAITESQPVSEILAPGFVVCRGVVRAIGAPELCGHHLESLPQVRVFPVTDWCELVVEIIPWLEDNVILEVKTKRLPPITRKERPRVQVELHHDEGALMVLPTIVYGSPPLARVHGDRLVHLQGDIPTRDRLAEKRVAQELRDKLNLGIGRKVKFYGRDAANFTDRLRRWQKSGADAETTEIDTVSLMPIVEMKGGKFDVSFQNADDPKASAAASASSVISAWRSGLGLVPLTDGGWAELPTEWLSQYGDRVEALLDARDEKGELPTFAMPQLAELCEDLNEPPPKQVIKIAELADDLSRKTTLNLPKEMSSLLRPYQREGITWLSRIAKAQLGGILADDMGLGKTIQALGAVKGRTLVICPRSVVHNWRNEISMYRPDLTVSTYHGAKRELDEKADVTIATYGVLRLDIDDLSAVEWGTIILDESQMIKNPDSRVARAAYRLQGKFRVALTGTPIENRLDELWSQAHFTNPGLLGGRRRFDDRFRKPIDAGKTEALEQLRRLIRPFMLRRLKQEVAQDLPPRSESVMYCELSTSERDAYDALRAASSKKAMDKMNKTGNVMAALEVLLRLRQTACHPALVPGQSAETSSKVERLVEAVDKARQSGHKSLVFSQWTSLLNLVEPHLKAAELDFLRLDGSTSNRQKVVDGFQADDGPPVLLISLKAGGTGLNLTAADHVFLLDPWWNPATEAQAADRAHRIGQNAHVMVYRLVAKNTVEEKVLDLQQRKRDIAESALSNSGIAASLTKADLMALLADGDV